MSYLDSLHKSSSRYPLPDGSFTTNFLEWHNSHSQTKVDVAAIAKQTFEKKTSETDNVPFEKNQSRKMAIAKETSNGELPEPDSPAQKQYLLPDGSYTTDFFAWYETQSLTKIKLTSSQRIPNEKKKESLAMPSDPVRALLEEMPFRRYKLADGSFTSEFSVYHNDQEGNAEGIRRRTIKNDMEAFSKFVSNLCAEKNSHNWFSSEKTFDNRYLAEKTYYLFGVALNIIPYGDDQCYEGRPEEFRQMAIKFTNEMLTINKYDHNKPQDIIKFLRNYMKTYPKMHPESLKDHVYFPRRFA
ncbi:MAG: hypothetical protein H0X29_11395 [Parachlamydiaceae bacterium]|nr:hypothetical protein [Parachlamydiaceae bacterium]